MLTRIKVETKGDSTRYYPQRVEKVWKWVKFRFEDEWVCFKERKYCGMGDSYLTDVVEFSIEEAQKYLDSYMREENHSVEYIYK